MNDYLIAYDISNPKRLAKLARQLEKHALRVQYSIFLLPNPTTEQLRSISQTIDSIITQDDDVRIYKIKAYGVALGCAFDLSEPLVFV